jgi:hypothetical protein
MELQNGVGYLIAIFAYRIPIDSNRRISSSIWARCESEMSGSGKSERRVQLMRACKVW